jgi:predicted DNA binding CopG/RHH family protein
MKKLRVSPKSSAKRGNFVKETNRRIPDFKNEDEEREPWATHSPLEFFDAKNSKKASFHNLKPSIKSISIRLPEDLLAELKILANKKDVPYQSLAKVFLARQIVLERESLCRGSRKRNVKTASRSK